MIGNDFLRFVDEYHGIRSDQLVRFMDDFFLFSDDKDIIKKDFILIQKLLGDKGLSINPSKTYQYSDDKKEIDEEIDEIKNTLLKRRRFLIMTDYDDDFSEVHIDRELNKKEVKYLNMILSKDNL